MMHANGHTKRPEYKGKWCVKKMHGDVEVFRCHVSEAYNTGFLGRLWGYFSFVFSSLWAGIFRTKDRYDLILVTSPPLFVGITAFLLSRLKRIPFVFEIRDLWPESAIDTGVVTNPLIIRFAYWFEGFIYRKAALINVLTPAFRTALVEKKKVPPSKVIFIPNAADFSLSDGLLKTFDRTAFRRQLNMEHRFVVTYVGAHGVANHLVQLLDAAELLRDTNVLFQLIGDGMQKPMLLKEAERRGLDNVVFRDSVPKAEVFRYILASEIGVSVLKRVDTFKTIYSNKSFDYMSCKRPILLCIDGVSRELVESAGCGTYAEPENAEDIAGKIRAYLNEPSRLVDEGERGYDYAKKNFDRTVLAHKYMTHLKEVVNVP